jgi:hypothetical protein
MYVIGIIYSYLNTQYFYFVAWMLDITSQINMNLYVRYMMKYFGEGLCEKHKELGKIIRKKDEISQAKSLFLDIHANLHLSETMERAY